MKMKNYITIGIIIMAMIVAGYFIYQNFSNPLPTQNTVPPQQNPDEAFSFQGNITIDEKDKNCTFDTDCTVISTVCGDCSLGVVNKVYTEKYESELNQVCGNPKIACDVDYRDTHEIKCVDLRCKFVPKQ